MSAPLPPEAPQADAPVLTWAPLVEGVLRRRWKRFLAEVELADGSLVTVHCANTGPMTGVLLPGGRVRLRHDPSPSRKLAWTWEQAEVPAAGGGQCWVGVNTALPNRLLRATIEAGLLQSWLGPVAGVRPEVAYGHGGRSRIDLLLTPDETADDPRPIYVEIKNTTWTDGSLALFPDTVTERGQKHLQDLMAVLPGARALLIPCLSRADVTAFAPGDSADPRYGVLFREALAAGVEVLPCRFAFGADGVRFAGVVPVLPRQPGLEGILSNS
ncbi:MAG: DNA/RNA nuclease SfsA [Synechococcus sp. Tobar2m-G35]|nr:DNA/RNA nuclease SfsA [Synechococcus sp. Tobar2m-G35]